MNKYARLAMRHWQQTDPERFRAIPDSDREAFFSQLGERAEIEIQQLQDALAGPDPPGEGYLEKVGRLNMARLQAEEQVLAGSARQWANSAASPSTRRSAPTRTAERSSS